MEFVNFMQSGTGRLLRALIGAVLIIIAMFWMSGGWAWIVGLVGVVLVAVGATRVCLAAPLFGASMTQHAD